MRNPKRINTIIKLIELIWEEYPDWRLGQLLSNITSRKIENMLFYYEDDILEKDLKRYIKSNSIKDTACRSYSDFLKKYLPKTYKEERLKKKVIKRSKTIKES